MSLKDRKPWIVFVWLAKVTAFLFGINLFAYLQYNNLEMEAFWAIMFVLAMFIYEMMKKVKE